MDLQTLISLTEFEHSRKVSQVSAMLAEYMGYSRAEIGIIRQAALLHDIGKADVSPKLLGKPGALTAQEFDVVKQHTRLGAEKIMDAIRTLAAAYEIVKSHHERLDGSGYVGLAGNEIHPFTRLVCIADVFDALLAKRPYRDAYSIQDALSYLSSQAGVKFDKDVVCTLVNRADDFAALYR